MINKAGIDLIKQFEGFRANAYQDSVGVWTIGYGTTAAAGLGIVPKKGMRISEEGATELLQAAVDKFAKQIRPKIKVAITENEFAACVSLAYNIGPGAFARSTVLRMLNNGDKRGAADAFLMWNKAGGRVLAGLTRRREAERALFLTPDEKPSTVAPEGKDNIFTAIFKLIAALIGALFKGRKP